MRNNKFFTPRFFYILTSVFFAIVLFFYANSIAIRNQGLSTNGEVHTASISTVPVELKYDSDKYFVSGYNNTANVYLTGYNNLQINTEVNQASRSFYLVADLTNLSEGTNNVPIRINQLPSGVNAQIEPSTLTVTIEKKASQDFSVTPQVNLSQIPDGFTVDSISLSHDDVKVTAGSNSIKQIHQIVATLPSGTALTDNYTGTVTLHAVDKSGKILPAQISPSTVQMKVRLHKPSKTVPVTVKTVGELDSSLKEVKTSSDVKTVVIYGTKDALDKISSVTAKVDITGVTDKKEESVVLNVDDVTVRPSAVKVTLEPVKKD